jgi:hypothetical protein
MIHMPHRSVTRFFIPLIDVLLLLFGIFLLMPIVSETELDEQRETVHTERETVEALQYELRRRTEDLHRLENLRPELARVEQLKEEIERLRAVSRKDLQARVDVHVIDIDAKTGALSYYDPGRSNPRVPLVDEAAARQLVERHLREARERDVYYYFLFPRPETGYPTLPQQQRYVAWFTGVPNSLKEARP